MSSNKKLENITDGISWLKVNISYILLAVKQDSRPTTEQQNKPIIKGFDFALLVPVLDYSRLGLIILVSTWLANETVTHCDCLSRDFIQKQNEFIK